MNLQGTARCNADQMVIQESSYGRRDPNCEARVKGLFRQLKLDEAYDEYAEKTAAELEEMITDIDESERLRKGVFRTFLSKMHKRNK